MGAKKKKNLRWFLPSDSISCIDIMAFYFLLIFPLPKQQKEIKVLPLGAMQAIKT